MAEHNEWESSTRRVHFVCGVVVGSVLGFRLGWEWLFSPHWWAGILIVILSAALVGWRMLIRMNSGAG
jgi:hypothetical protein